MALLNKTTFTMAAIPTIQIPLGFTAPNFKLYEPASNTLKSLDELKSDKATIVMFICNHCPFVKHIMGELVQLANEYIPKGISIIGINANDVKNFPEDRPERMKELVESMNIPFTYLFDETQRVAKDYSAACTPDFNVFDKDMKCVYRGQLDDSRPGNNIPVTGKDIRATLDALLENKRISQDQKPSIGCSVKWK